jgi:hypothetical protein
VLQRKILQPRSFDELTRDTRLKDGTMAHYGLGISLGEMGGTPVWQHGGEVSGFLADNRVFPTRNGAVIVLSNQDCVGLSSPLGRQLAQAVFQAAATPESPKETARTRSVVEALRRGKIDRDLFTANANSYFTEQALTDAKASLAPLGKLKAVTWTGESARGGMRHMSYRAQLDKKTLSLNIYVTPAGKYEQFLVEESI